MATMTEPRQAAKNPARKISKPPKPSVLTDGDRKRLARKARAAEKPEQASKKTAGGSRVVAAGKGGGAERVAEKPAKAVKEPKPPKAPKPPPPMQVFVASIGSTCYVITGKDPRDARAFLSKIRDGVDKVRFRQIDQTVRQMWGLFPLTEVIMDGAGKVEITRLPAINIPPEPAEESETVQMRKAALPKKPNDGVPI